MPSRVVYRSARTRRRASLSNSGNGKDRGANGRHRLPPNNPRSTKWPCTGNCWWQIKSNAGGRMVLGDASRRLQDHGKVAPPDLPDEVPGINLVSHWRYGVLSAPACVRAQHARALGSCATRSRCRRWTTSPLSRTWRTVRWRLYRTRARAISPAKVATTKRITCPARTGRQLSRVGLLEQRRLHGRLRATATGTARARARRGRAGAASPTHCADESACRARALEFGLTLGKLGTLYTSPATLEQRLLLLPRRHVRGRRVLRERRQLRAERRAGDVTSAGCSARRRHRRRATRSASTRSRPPTSTPPTRRATTS